MKMMSSTSMTSTSGTTLISASDVEMRRRRPPNPGSVAAGACTLGTRQYPQALREIPLGNVQELHREIIHVGREQLHAVREVVVGHDRRNGRRQSEGRGNQRFRDRLRDDAQARGTRLA